MVHRQEITMVDITSIHSQLTPLGIMLCQGNCKKFQGSVLHKLFAKVDNVLSFRQKSAAATKNFLLRKIGLNVFLITSFPNQSNCCFYLSQISALI